MTFEQRSDGLWIVFAGGEEAGPFAEYAAAKVFLDDLANLQRAQK